MQIVARTQSTHPQNARMLRNDIRTRHMLSVGDTWIESSAMNSPD